MNLDFCWRALMVFVSGAVVDAAWTYYIMHTGAGHKWRASLSSAFIVLANGLIVIEFVNDARFLLVSAAGGFVGAFSLMHYREWRKSKLPRRHLA